MVANGTDRQSQWWFNLRTHAVEQGPGDPNSDRLGPFDTQAEAESALDLARERSEAWDADEGWNDSES